MTLLHAALLAFMMFAAFAHTLTMNVVAAAAACPVTVRSCLYLRVLVQYSGRFELDNRPLWHWQADR
ncbi:hypothetical protein GY45DRAFT_1325706, partial [Cubamyces sp. BRFM 1775]